MQKKERKKERKRERERERNISRVSQAFKICAGFHSTVTLKLRWTHFL
jgi:hypothetical protein